MGVMAGWVLNATDEIIGSANGTHYTPYFKPRKPHNTITVDPYKLDTEENN